MNFDAPLLKPIRILLFPFSLIYGAIVWLRNRLFDHGFFDSTSFNLPVICVGNLSTGGTGKSPMVEYLATILRDEIRLAILSRGYKRKTRGFALASEQTTALDIGDEPTLFFRKFPDITVAVGEERVVAIPQLLHEKPDTEVIILDDAFQHRAVKPGFNILLSDSNNLYTRDWFLPTGDLRDEKSSASRAEIIVVTKCRPELTQEESASITEELKPLKTQHVFFSSIDYGTPYHLTTGKARHVTESDEVLLVTGIANPTPLKKYLLENSGTYYEILYEDHHIFSIDDWNDIIRRYKTIPAERKMILTTEKDAVRLIKFQHMVDDLPVYVMPIKMKFLFNSENRFHELISKFIGDFRKTKHKIDA